MTTYFNQLKEKHDSPQKAYKEYVLSKTLLANFYCSENACDFTKEAFKIYENYKKVALAFIDSDSHVNVADMLGMPSDYEDRRMFRREHHKYCMFLGIDWGFQTSLLVNYQGQLSSASKGVTWDSLEKLMVTECNNEIKMSEKEVKEKLKNICQNYALESLTVGNVACQKDKIDKIDISLNQLSSAVECKKKQVGAGVFNVFIDNEDVNAAGYSNQYAGRQKIFLYSVQSQNAFAHEWLHGVDNIIATQNSLGVELASNDKNNKIEPIALLMDKIKNNVDDEVLIKDYLSNKTVEYLKLYIDRGVEVNAWQDSYLLQDFLIKEKEKIKNGNWGRQFFKDCLNGFATQENKPHHQYYIISEMELLNKLSNQCSLNTNIFMEYANIMDKNLADFNFLEKDEVYSTTNHELIARSFETLVDIKLKNKNIKNIISTVDTAYIPMEEAVGKYSKEWDGVLEVIRDNLNKLYPVFDSPLEKLNVIRKENKVIKQPIVTM